MEQLVLDIVRHKKERYLQTGTHLLSKSENGGESGQLLSGHIFFILHTKCT